jgi:hypothetical protein
MLNLILLSRSIYEIDCRLTGAVAVINRVEVGLNFSKSRDSIWIVLELFLKEDKLISWIYYRRNRVSSCFKVFRVVILYCY